MPLAQSWQDLEQATGGRAVLKGSPEEIRSMYDGLIQMLLPQLPKPSENVESKDGEVDGIKYRLYWPKNATGPLPTCIWTHGGGYMLGDLNGDDLLCRAVAEHTNSAVVGVDYRLAPEHKWPSQLEDAMKVYRWAHQNASSFHGDPKRFYTYGGSAGGHLALMVAIEALKDPQLKPGLRGVAAICPATVHYENVPDKYKSSYTAYTENANDAPIIDKESMDIFYHHAVLKSDDTKSWPLLVTEIHKDFPPVYFASCGFDPLRDDAYAMEKALKEAGVPTKHDHYKDFPHFFWIFPSVPEGQQFVGNMLAGIGWLQSQM